MSEFFASSAVQMIVIFGGIVGVLVLLFWLAEHLGSGTPEVEHTIDSAGVPEGPGSWG